MGIFRGIFRAGVTFAFSVVLPLLGNGIARAYGIHLLLIDENVIIAVGLALTILMFLKNSADRRIKFRGFIGVAIVAVEVWYFLLFLEMVSAVSLPILNTNITVQYMGEIGEVPNHLLAVASALASSTSIDFPVLGDLILLSFGLVFLREVLLMIEGWRSAVGVKEEGSRNQEGVDRPSTEPQISG